MRPGRNETQYHVRLADGRVLACLEVGDPASHAILYFHGYPGSRLEGRLWADMARRFHVRVIAPDRPGFGESTFELGRTIGDWAEDVRELLDRLGLDKAAAIGASGGGPYALACAARIPGRLSRVALLGGLGPVDCRHLPSDMVRLNRLSLALAARAPALARLAVDAATLWIRADPAGFVAAMATGASAPDRLVLADADYHELTVESTAEAVRQGARGAAWELGLLARPWGFALQAVEVPVYIWHGLGDRIVPASMARHLAQALPHGEIHCLPDEGHLLVRHFGAVLAQLSG